MLTGQSLSPPWAQAHAQPWQVSLSPVPTAAPGQRQGKVLQSQLPVGLGVRGLLEGPTSNPSLASGRTGSLRGTGALPGARDVPLSPWACVRAGTEGRGTGTAFTGRISPTRTPARKEGVYRISPCLQVWKQPWLPARQPGTGGCWEGTLPWGQSAHRPTAGPGRLRPGTTTPSFLELPYPGRGESKPRAPA